MVREQHPIKRWFIREGVILGVCALLGLIALPISVYLVGERLLGSYGEDAGLGVFLRDFYGYMIQGEPGALALAAGPYVLLQSARLLIWPLRAFPKKGRAAIET
jgi:hypothetical protein